MGQSESLDPGLRRDDSGRADRPLGAAALLALCCAPANAHDLSAAAASASAGWSVEPWVLACLAASAGLYALGVVRLWSHAGRLRGIGGWQVASFAAGWLTLVAALVSPLDALGSRLFVAHMLQHELLMVVAAPLFVLARPLVAWTWALPPAARRRAGAITRHPGWRGPWRLISAPLGAWLAHALALWAWHAPALFDAALANDGVHALQHASFLATALLFWWSVLGREAPGLALASLFTTMLHTGALGALLALAPSPWYAYHLDATAAFGLAPLEDQQLGGLVMWIPAGFAYLGAGLALAARLLGGWRAAPLASKGAAPG